MGTPSAVKRRINNNSYDQNASQASLLHFLCTTPHQHLLRATDALKYALVRRRFLVLVLQAIAVTLYIPYTGPQAYLAALTRLAFRHFTVETAVSRLGRLVGHLNVSSHTLLTAPFSSMVDLSSLDPRGAPALLEERGAP